MGIEEGEETQTKGIDNLFNKIIAENFCNLEKGRDIQVQECHQVHQDLERNTTRHIIIKIFNKQLPDIS
jgi:hypothetical protein